MKKGIDAPLVPVMFLLVGVLGLGLAIAAGTWTSYIFPVILFGLAGVYLHTSLRGKYQIIQKLVQDMALASDAQVLDLGTGHGAFLLEIAHQLKAPGKVIGLDIWNQGDQSRNSVTATQQNIDQAGVQAVSELVTGDMTKLPFTDNQFEAVVASLSIHNVKPQSSRQTAIREAYRVLKPTGQMVIMDIEHIREYRQVLGQLGAREIRVQHAGFDGMYGAMSTRILIARK